MGPGNPALSPVDPPATRLFLLAGQLRSSQDRPVGLNLARRDRLHVPAFAGPLGHMLAKIGVRFFYEFVGFVFEPRGRVGAFEWIHFFLISAPGKKRDSGKQTQQGQFHGLLKNQSAEKVAQDVHATRDSDSSPSGLRRPNGSLQFPRQLGRVHRVEQFLVEGLTGFQLLLWRADNEPEHRLLGVIENLA